MANRRPNRLSDQLRQIIDDSGLTRYRISREARIDQSAMSKFYHGQAGLSLKALDRLAEFLELTVASRRKPNTTQGK